MRKLWTKCKSIASKARYVVPALVGAMTLGVSSAHAVLPVEEQAVFDDIALKVSDLQVAALGLLTTILIAFIGFKLVKKFVYKAT